MLALTACSNRPVGETPVLVETAVIHPAVPAPVKLMDEKFTSTDGKGNVCMPSAEAQKIIQNKVSVGKWMSTMRNINAYYRTAYPGK